MDTRDVKAEFAGFGPITSSKTTFAQGVGLGSSFAPVWTTEPKLPPKTIATSVSLNDYPFMLQPKQQEFAYVVKLNYGEVAGVAPDGLTREEDYIINPGVGEYFVYLIITFDGDGLITDRTIEYATEVPDDTDDVKHMVIGQVISEGLLFPYSVYQNISQDVYTEKATFIENDTIPSHLFADPRKIHLTNIDETFVADIDGTETISKLYLENAGETEYIELKKDSAAGEVVVGGYAGTEAQNFILSSNDTDGVSKLELFDTNSANFFTSAIDSANKVSVRGYSNNEEQQFLIEANSVDGVSKSVLFDSGSANCLESKVDTDSGKTSVYGYTDNASNYFLLQAKTDDTKLYLEDGGDNATLHPYALVINNSDGSTGTYEPHQLTISIASGDQSYLSTSALLIETSIGDGTYEPHQLTLRDSNGGVDANTAEIKTYNSIGGYAAIGSEGTMDLADGSGDICEARATGIAFTDMGNTRNSALSETGLLIAKPNKETTITEDSITIDHTGSMVFIDIPTADGVPMSATWKEIDICVDGEAKKMMVLGTDPY
jgi:hypothetical protein